jgi:hypothetical protein
MAFVADAGDGRWHLPDRDWPRTLDWMHSETGGPFRVLWLGDPSVLPVDPERRGDVGYGVTDDGPGDVRALLPPPERGASALLGETVDLLRERRTNRIGRALGLMGVRFVAVPERTGPGLERTAPVPSHLDVALDDQLDLTRLDSEPGIALYENEAWVPVRAAVPAGTAVPSRSSDPVRDSLSVDLSRARGLGSGAVDPGTILLGEAYSSSWTASAGGRTLHHRRAFGWANGWSLEQRAPVTISYERQWVRWLGVLLQLALVAGAVVLWRGRLGFRRRRPAVAGAGDPAPGDPALVRVGDAAEPEASA